MRARPSGWRAGALAGLAAAAVMAAVVAAAFFSMRGLRSTTGALVKERLVWDGAAGPPRVVGDGDAVAGRARGADDAEIFVVTIDPSTALERSRLGPFASDTEADAALTALSRAEIDAGAIASPEVTGFVSRRVRANGGVAVAAGVEGTTPTAVGFDPTTRALTWRSAVPVNPDQVDPAAAFFLGAGADALAGGRYVSLYGVTGGRFHATAFDARTGTRAWDVELAPGDPPLALVASASHVYVTHAHALEILEATTGRVAGTF